MHKFVRLIQATIYTKRQVDEQTTKAHLSEALRKECDRSGFRATPRARSEKKTTTNTSTADERDVGTSGHVTGWEGHKQGDSDEESVGPVSSITSDDDIQRAAEQQLPDEDGDTRHTEARQSIYWSIEWIKISRSCVPNVVLYVIQRNHSSILDLLSSY